MLKRGIDISKHRSQPITNDLLRHFDLILTMERFHKEKLRDVFPEDSDRIYMITEMTGVCEDIPDPIDHGAEDYEATAKLLERTFNSSLNWIVELATKNHKKRQDLLETRA
jgi:protein-tyrosine-phosphatase